MRWRRPRGTDVMLTGVTVGGFAMLAAALGVTRAGPGEWAAGVLVNVGAAVLLVIPLYLLNRRMDERIERVRVETVSGVQALTERVSAFESEVERRLGDVAESVSARLAQERVDDMASFDALLHTPTRRAVEEALRRADELGLISRKRGPRVCVSETWQVYVRVGFIEAGASSADGLVRFVVEDVTGKSLDTVQWLRDESVEDVMVRVGRAVHRTASTDDFNVEALFRGLREALGVAYSHPHRRPIYQLCPPQWAVTDRGMVTYGVYGAVPLCHFHVLSLKERLDVFSEELADKPWIHFASFDAAQEAALALALHAFDPPF